MSVNVTVCLQTCCEHRTQGNLHPDKLGLHVKMHFRKQLPASINILSSCRFQLINFNSTSVLYKTICMLEKQVRCNYILCGSLLINRNDVFCNLFCNKRKRAKVYKWESNRIYSMLASCNNMQPVNTREILLKVTPQ